ncbi:RNA-directed DNA polymerase, eukaryota, reverse transcriptase zinc-binding domain protein [Tanacetum coccineum]
MENESALNWSKKSTWVKWNNVLAPKKKWGLGVSSLYALNRGLMCKWVWRFYTHNASLWERVIKAIHGDEGKLGDGVKITFWEDSWIGGNALKDLYPRMYALETCKLVNVGTKLAHSILDSSFRRKPRGGVEQEQYEALSGHVHDVTLVPISDRWIWSLESSGEFSVASIRKVIDDKRLPVVATKTRWIKYVPIKVNIYAWKVKIDSLPTRINISRRCIDIESIMCPICDNGAESSRGLNIGSLKSFNLALLQKWRWRWFSFPNAIWVKVIKAIHGQEGGFDTYGCNFNGIWARIVGSSNFLHSKNIIPLNSFRFKAGCGTHIRFWKDIWIGDSPLIIRYNRLYRLELDKDCLIIDRIKNGQWSWNWSRNDLGVQARRVIDDIILPSLATSTSWDKILPHKVNIFMWRLMLDWLPHRLNLSSRGIDIQSILCPSCNGNVESSNHIFFNVTSFWRFRDLFLYGAISLVLLLLLLSIETIGPVCGKLIKRRSIVSLLSSFRLFGGFGDFAIVSLFVHTR